MRAMFHRPRSLLAGLALALAVPAAARGQFLDGKAPERESGWKALGERIREQFSDPSLYAEMALVLVLAMVMGAVIAYHPSTRKKASTITELEQPKTFIMYALVGALVGHVVAINTVMGIVVFGIGGLLRFRTEVGEPKDTGRVILVTLIGISCGLGSLLVAFLATLFGWVVIWYLEREVAGRLQVKGLEGEVIPEAAVAYREALESAGCTVIGAKQNFMKGQVTIVFRAPHDLDEDELEEALSEIPEEVQGAVDWDMS